MKNKKIKMVVVIPAHNEEKTIGSVIAKIPSTIEGVKKIEAVVVDDCSKDNTAKIAKAAGAHVLSHAMNLGAGGATLTGITYAQRLGADVVVTLDADGQHKPQEITRLVDSYFKYSPDMVIGSRFLSKSIKKMPGVKKVGNKSFSYITYFLSGKMLSDTQSGFRLFGKKIIKLLSIADLAGYEFCSETIMLAHKNRLTITEVPISTIYYKGRTGGQNPLNGVNILLRLIYRKLVG